MHFSKILVLATTTITAFALPLDTNLGVSTEANVHPDFKRDILAKVGHGKTEHMPPNLPHRNVTGGIVTKPRFRNQNLRFTCEVEIGTKHNTFKLDIDTASSTTWVYGRDPYAGKYAWQRKVRNKVTYNSKDSEGSRHVKNYGFREAYMDGTGALGRVYTDVVRVAGIESKIQSLGVAKIISPRFNDDLRFQGVLGLGKHVLKGEKGWDGNKGWFDNVGESLIHNLFTLQMKADGGHIDFGYINQTRFTGELFWMDTVAVNTPYHVFETTGYSIGDGPMKPLKVYAAPDSTASIILVPDAIADEYYDQFPLGVEKVILPGHHTGYTYPCQNLFVPPDFTLQLTDNNAETKNFVIPGKDLEFQVIRPGICLGALQAQTPRKPTEHEVTVLGWPFLQNKFIVFDKGTRIAFADAAQKPTTE